MSFYLFTFGPFILCVCYVICALMPIRNMIHKAHRLRTYVARSESALDAVAAPEACVSVSNITTI